MLMLPPISVKVLTPRKCYKFPCSELVTDIEVDCITPLHVLKTLHQFTQDSRP